MLSEPLDFRTPDFVIYTAVLLILPDLHPVHNDHYLINYTWVGDLLAGLLNKHSVQIQTIFLYLISLID